MRVVLHIGTEKTGTSALQIALTRHRVDLEQHGFVYSRAAGDDSHVLPAFCCGDHDHVADLRNDLGFDPGLASDTLRQAFADALKAEVATYPNHTFIISSEHFHSRLITHAEVNRLANLFRKHFDDIRILVYLRPQDEVVASFYSTYVRVGGQSDDVFQVRPEDPYLDYRSLLVRWGDVFGLSNLDVAIYDRRTFPGASIINDFLGRIGFPAALPDQVHENLALPHAFQDMLRFLTAELHGLPEQMRRKVIDTICNSAAQQLSGKPRSLTRLQAQKLMKRFEEDNDWICRRFFPDRPSLFRQSFDQYPETDRGPVLAARDSVGNIVVRELLAEMRTLAERTAYVESELAYYKGLLYLNAGEIQLARSVAVDGLEFSPRHAPLWHLSARALHAAGQSADASAAMLRACELDPENPVHTEVLQSFTSPPVGVTHADHVPPQRRRFRIWERRR